MLRISVLAVVVCVGSVLSANPNYSYHVKIEDPAYANFQQKAETRLGEKAEGFYRYFLFRATNLCIITYMANVVKCNIYSYSVIKINYKILFERMVKTKGKIVLFEVIQLFNVTVAHFAPFLG